VAAKGKRRTAKRAARPAPLALVPVFIPSLAAILVHAQDVKGSPLTEDEVLSVRDASTVIMLPAEAAEELSETRGYRDLNPENVWAEYRELLAKNPGLLEP